VSVNERGMTLVELLVAVFIITVGLVAIGAGFQIATVGVAVGQQQTTATLLAEQRLESIRSYLMSSSGTQGFANITSTNFAAAEAYGSIANYTTYRRSTTITDPTATTKRVTVEVFWRPVAVSSTTNAERSVVVSALLSSRE
jgi:prepilin-type N-terminal cleavage/methylation domain-containing protein